MGADENKPMGADERQLRMVNPAMASALYDPESMADFKVRVDKLITELKKSPAGATNVGADPMVRPQFGGGGASWHEAHGVFGAYDTVIKQLEKLSGLLHDCLEGMGIAVLASKDGFEGLDEEQRRKMALIHQRTETYYDYDRDPVAQQVAKDEAARREQAKGGETAGGNGSLK
ncbi:hypothetical protein ABT160_03505 [Streptomyces sp. NPDC001941]|uniref:hypothetical protein n=1 Tax=Streptomyces sp. NPDC001941 TaxID=3154659 RepID=UPI0033323671